MVVLQTPGVSRRGDGVCLCTLGLGFTALHTQKSLWAHTGCRVVAESPTYGGTSRHSIFGERVDCTLQRGIIRMPSSFLLKVRENDP